VPSSVPATTKRPRRHRGLHRGQEHPAAVRLHPRHL